MSHYISCNIAHFPVVALIKDYLISSLILDMKRLHAPGEGWYFSFLFLSPSRSLSLNEGKLQRKIMASYLLIIIVGKLHVESWGWQ